LSIKSKRIVSVVMSVVFVLCTAFATSGLTDSQKSQLNKDISALQSESKKIQNEINALKKQKNNQAAVLAAIEKQIANITAQINRCNAEISSINSKIAANKAEINKKNEEIAADKLAFQKRIRALYMSNSNNTAKILLGSESFSEYLQMAQLTASVSARDKQIMNDLKEDIKELEAKNAENEKLLQSQVAIKGTIVEKQSALKAQQSEASALYNSIASEQKQSEQEKASVDSEIKAKQKALEDAIRGASGSYAAFINPNNNVQWPVNGFRSISAGFQSNDSVHKGHHNGIDIAGGGIQGQPIRAMADGIVTIAYNGCSHNYKKSGNCCGNGYGNYCVVNHGTIKGNNYVAYYAHASSITVSVGQKVTQGQVLGYVGTTGWSTGYHLHFGVLKNGSWINPLALF